MNLRIFEDENGKMNLSVLDVRRHTCCITVHIICRLQKGEQASFTDARLMLQTGFISIL